MQPQSQPQQDLLTYVIERLPKQGEAHFMERVERVATGSGVPVHTVLKIINGQTKDPRVSTVQLLHDYLRMAEAA